VAGKWCPGTPTSIDLRQEEGTLFSGLSNDRRNDIRKARADGLVAREAPDFGQMRSLMMSTLARQKKTISPAIADRILTGFQPGEYCYGFRGRGRGRPAAGVFVIHDDRIAYYLIGGYADGAHHGAGALALWSAILKARQLGLQTFDFEGSVIPSIERYFRGFGAS